MPPTKAKISKLTQEQEQQLTAYRDHWLALGRSTEPADRPRAEAAIGKMYAWKNERPPYVWWCDGPAVGSMVRTALRSRHILAANLVDSLGNTGFDLRADLGGNLRDKLWKNLWDNLRKPLWDNLRANLWGDVRTNLWNKLTKSVWDNIEKNIGWCFFGLHECHGHAYAEFPDKYVRPMHSDEEREKLQAWLDISASCGWWQPFQGVVFVCDRPSICSLDDRGRLHSDAGPAYLWRDSFAVYAWHGVRVSSRVIEHPEDLTVVEIREQTNVEARRVMIERYGMSRYLLDAGAKQIHADEMGELYRVDLPGDEPLCMVKVMNSTPEPDGSRKAYFLRVPPGPEGGAAGRCLDFQYVAR